MRDVVLALLLAAALVAATARATETENLGIQVLPAPGKVVVDGRFDDWDLSGGVFACGDVENLRDKLACWFHMIYDAENLYLLARWTDESPMNNPGSSRGDYGFNGDCLQARIITVPGTPNERCTHVTAWMDRDGIDVVHFEIGRKFDGGTVKDAQALGAAQEFRKNDDGRGYVQELAIPWKLLCKEGVPAPKAGDEVIVTVEPNFCTEARFRITIKDIFKSGVVPDRVFTFMSNQCWGTGTLERKGRGTPRPLRLADGREFKVTMEKGLPIVDWTGLIQVKQLLGFKEIAFTMPDDGYISLNIRDSEDAVVRQLLNTEFRTKGRHVVKWDGLTTPNWRQPGEPVPPGAYTWDALWHKGIGLRLVGWACNSGSAPWDGPSGRTNWGGDHGVPFACDAGLVAVGGASVPRVFLGWSGAEAGKAIVACDRDGAVQWRLSRHGMSGAELLAVDVGTVYAMNWNGQLFRADAKTGGFTDWAGSGSTDLDVHPLVGVEPEKKERPDCLHARGGRVYVGFSKRDTVLVLDGASGKLIRKLAVPVPVDIEAVAGPAGGASAPRVFIISDWKAVLAVNPDTGEAKPFIENLQGANALALDAKGNLYVAMGEPENQVRVYNPEGKLLRAIGRKGGRALLGPWQPDGMRFVKSITVDATGQLWAMEADDKPKRVSVWNTETGQLVRELFGPSAYGALGGAINPLDPYVMVGHSCEWRIDPKTGRDRCLGVITRDGTSNARFAVGANGRLYLALAANWAFNIGPLKIYERLGDADYRLRTAVYYTDKDGKEIPPTAHGKSANAAMTMVWADENGDGERQPDELSGAPGEMKFSGWYMNVTPDLTLYSGDKQFKVAGFTPCGAPKYTLANPTKMPLPGLGSADGSLVLKGGNYGVDMTWFQCGDIARGREIWRYPDNFNGVHGSHRAVPPQVGMIRGSFGPCGAAKLPEPIGNIWVIATNCGEWHILTGQGYYLTRLFQGDPMKMAFPEAAVPGAILDNVPPGMGGEDFGGSIAATPDGQLHLQAGKTAFWNVRVIGLDSVKRLEPARRGGLLGILGRTKSRRITITELELAQARTLREKHLQEAVGTRRITIKKMTPALTGDFDKDFKGAEVVSYNKQDDAAARTAAAWDDGHLYLAWSVKDATPWVNGAEAPEFLYASGDTVDFQLGADPAADPKRAEAVLGDLRLSIGPFKGTPTAVLYRPKAAEKAPKKFYSGVVRDGYTIENVSILKDVKIIATPHRDKKGYTVQAAIPLAVLGIKPTDGLTLRGDFGVTHGDPAGKDTALRTHWSNQATGIVNDEVFELKLEPRNWGELILRP